MANINLSQSHTTRSRQETDSVFDKSLVISLALIIIPSGIFFGLQTYNASLDSKMATLNGEIQAQLAQLEGDSINHVIDFQERMTQIESKLTDTSISPQDMFAAVEKKMVPGASLDEYKYDIKSKALSLKIVSGDFKVLAQQMMNFKSGNSFRNVVAENSERREDGKVTSDVIISF